MTWQLKKSFTLTLTTQMVDGLKGTLVKLKDVMRFLLKFGNMYLGMQLAWR